MTLISINTKLNLLTNRTPILHHIATNLRKHEDQGNQYEKRKDMRLMETASRVIQRQIFGSHFLDRDVLETAQQVHNDVVGFGRRATVSATKQGSF